MVADIAATGLIGLFAGRFMTLNFIRSTPINFMSVGAIEISSFHGNTDSLRLFFFVLSAYLCQVHKSYFWAALSLSCSINIRIIPILVLPLFFFTIPDWRSRCRFISGLVPGALLLWFGYYMVRDPFLTNIFGYRPYPEASGFPLVGGYFYPEWADRLRAYGAPIVGSTIGLLSVVQ